MQTEYLLVYTESHVTEAFILSVNLYTESPDINSDTQFQQLVIFFGELIGNNIFSHDQYLCTLIARNDLSEETLKKLDIILNFKESYSPVKVQLFLFFQETNKTCFSLAQDDQIGLTRR